MTLSKVVRKGSYQGVAQWGISTSSEITPLAQDGSKVGGSWRMRGTQSKRISCGATHVAAYGTSCSKRLPLASG